MTNSQNDTPKCLSAVLRRLLCTGSLPTHPSDLITEPNTTANNHPPNYLSHPQLDSRKEQSTKPQAPYSPGIVARLMGLDSYPDFNFSHKKTTLESILRSRSVNSVNYLPEFDPTQSHHHRRVRTSVSFRQENSSDFLVLCFEKVSGSSKLSLSGGKSEMGFEGLKQREVETEGNRGDSGEREFEKKKKKKKVVRERKGEEKYRICTKFSSKVDNVNLPQESNKSLVMGLEGLKQRKVETETNRGDSGERRFEKKKKVVGERKGEMNGKCCSKADNGNSIRKNKVSQGKSDENLKGKSGVKGLNQKETSVYRSKVRNKKKNGQRTKKVETMFHSENSNPVSVIEIHNVLNHHETTPSGDSRVPIPNPRNKSSSHIANYENPPPNSPRNFVADDYLLKAKKNRGDKPKKTVQNYSELVREIIRFTEEEMKESKWVGEEFMMNYEDVEEMCCEFGQQILDLLFHQVLVELVGM